MKIRKRRTYTAIDEILAILKKRKLRRHELLIVLGQVLVQVGYSIYYQTEAMQESPPERITAEEARALEKKNPTLGSMIMRVGFDFQGGLLQSLKEEEERRLGKTWKTT